MAGQAYVIDLRSDTVTKPTEAMRHAMAKAEVGDDVYGEDPTVNALEAKLAELMGKEAALFVPSGTMANLIAVMVHCNKRGAEMICGDLSHIYRWEQGCASQIAGVTVTTLQNKEDGTFELEELAGRVRGADVHEPLTTLVAVENTHNMCGGKVLPLEWLDKLSAMVAKLGLGLHMDGSRLFNAAEYLREEPARLVRGCHSVAVCFSKGLGAPVGSALAGTAAFIQQARRVRKALGGGMRQAGVLAAAAILALDEHVPALYADHRRANYIAKEINALKFSLFSVDIDNQHTNIVAVKMAGALTSAAVATRLQLVTGAETSSDCKTSAGDGIVVKVSHRNPKVLRLVTHIDIKDEDVRHAVKKISFVFKEFEANKKNYM